MNFSLCANMLAMGFCSDNHNFDHSCITLLTVYCLAYPTSITFTLPSSATAVLNSSYSTCCKKQNNLELC